MIPKGIQHEHILCAAIWIDDGIEYPHQKVVTGRLFCGHRHCSIIAQFGRNYALMNPTHKKIQGFLTSYGNFADRKEAASIAYLAGQTDELQCRLYSEDLY